MHGHWIECSTEQLQNFFIIRFTNKSSNYAAHWLFCKLTSEWVEHQRCQRWLSVSTLFSGVARSLCDPHHDRWVILLTYSMHDQCLIMFTIVPSLCWPLCQCQLQHQLRSQAALCSRILLKLSHKIQNTGPLIVLFLLPADLCLDNALAVFTLWHKPRHVSDTLLQCESQEGVY